MKKTLIKKGLREVWAHKVQYILLILILGIGIASYGSLYNMSDTRLVTLEAIFDESKFMDVQVQFQYGVNGDLGNVEDLIEDPDMAKFIDRVEYRFVYDIFVNHTDGGETKTTRGQVIGYRFHTPQGTVRKLDVNRPLYFSDSDPEFSSGGARECVIEHKFARAYGIDNGENVTALKGDQQFNLTVLDHASVPEFFFVMPEGSLFPSERSFGVLLLPMDTAQELYFGSLRNDTMVNNIVIILKDGGDTEKFMDLAEERFRSAGIPVKVTEDSDNPSFNFLWEDYRNDKDNQGIFPVIIFGVSGFGLIIALRRMIQTHRAQIGIFKALGIPNGVVLRYFAFIGLVIGIISIGLGLLLSIPINNVFNSLLRDLYDFAIMRTAFTWRHYIVAGAISMILCLACTIVPAWLALRIKPIDAIQSREGVNVKKIGKVANRIGRMRRIPVSLKLTIRNLVRRPQRTISTTFGIALALGLFLSFALVLQSFVYLLDDTSRGNRWDYEIGLDEFENENIGREWQVNHTGIETLNPGLMLPVQIVDGADSEEALLYAVDDVKKAFKLDMERGKYREGELVVSITLANELGIGVGDVISVLMFRFDPVGGYSPNKVELSVSGIQKNHMGPLIFADLAPIHVHTNLTGMVNVVYLTTENGDESIAMENALITTPGVRSVTHRSERQNLLDQYFDLLMQTMVVMGAISMILAGAIVYNMFRISAQESRRDYATMKTLGTSVARLGKLIFIEGLFITILGIAFGTLVGYLLAIYMMRVTTDLGFELPIIFSWAGFIAGAVMIAVVVLIVSMLTIRYIGRINMADVIRERSS